MHPLIQLKTTRPLLITLTLLCFGLLPTLRAVSPAPDGGYPGLNTAEGQKALFSLTTATGNVAVGWGSLYSDAEGNFNTAIGTGALLFNTADQNTATGAGALLSNTNGSNNTASGFEALFSNTSGPLNTASGAFALFSNTTGTGNTANGQGALVNNISGYNNTADGISALYNNTTGGFNIALGIQAGSGVTTASNVICIGADGNNVDNACYIGNIFNSTSSGGIAVFVNSNGRLGTATSSRRFKQEIKPMDKASEAVFALKPVTFRYKKEIDAGRTSQFGLVAEEVGKVSSDLIVCDKEGKPYSVRYDQVNAMLLNEFLKEHTAFVQEQHKVEKLEATVASLVTMVKEQAAQMQKVSAQLEASKPAPQIVNNP